MRARLTVAPGSTATHHVWLGVPGHPCGKIIRQTQRRCDVHRRQFDRERRPNFNRRYGKGWRAQSKAAREAQPCCSRCGATTNLQADHLVPGDPDSEIRVLCRRCHATIGRRRDR